MATPATSRPIGLHRAPAPGERWARMTDSEIIEDGVVDQILYRTQPPKKLGFFEEPMEPQAFVALKKRGSTLLTIRPLGKRWFDEWRRVDHG